MAFGKMSVSPFAAKEVECCGRGMRVHYRNLHHLPIVPEHYGGGKQQCCLSTLDVTPRSCDKQPPAASSAVRMQPRVHLRWQKFSLGGIRRKEQEEAGPMHASKGPAVSLPQHSPLSLGNVGSVPASLKSPHSDPGFKYKLFCYHFWR